MPRSGDTAGRAPGNKPFVAGLVIFCMCLIAGFTFSKPAHAGLFSMIFGGDQASAQTAQTADATNSQTLSLLQASVNYDPNPDKPADLIPVNDGETLSADIAAVNATGTDTGSNTQISSYVVREGDTISSVAKMFDVSSNTVRWANNLSSKSAIKPGQTLVILPITGITYTIKSGDTLQGISKKYGADLTDVLDYNDLTLASRISVGDTILIPDGEISAVVAKPLARSSSRSVVPAFEPLLDNIANLPTYSGYYSCPVVGRLTQGLHGHNAVDLAAARGTIIKASAAGTVIISKSNGAWNGGYGDYVVISHSNSTQTLYAHMSKTAVSNGQAVVQGQPIGFVGMTGLTTGPHVHFEIRGARNPFDTVSCE